jgi:hypothetical protein
VALSISAASLTDTHSLIRFNAVMQSFYFAAPKLSSIENISKLFQVSS